MFARGYVDGVSARHKGKTADMQFARTIYNGPPSKEGEGAGWTRLV